MKRVHVVLIIFYNENGDILLHSRDDSPDFWSLLGGSVEENELPLDAIKREMKEEIGFEHENSISFIKSYIHSHSEDKEYELHLFEADFPGFDQLKDSDEVKLTELKFFAVDQITNLKKLIFAQLIFDDFDTIKRR